MPLPPLPPDPPSGHRNAPVEIVPYDAEWPQRFEAEKRVLADALAPWLAAPPEHVGSTAVPGLAAKPIIDILLPVGSHEASRDAVPVMERLGYLHWPTDPLRHVRHYFLKRAPSDRTHHAYLMEHDAPDARAIRAFRDHLRGSPVARDAYARLKGRLAEDHRDDRAAYSIAKTRFVREALAEAAPGLVFTERRYSTT